MWHQFTCGYLSVWDYLNTTNDQDPAVSQSVSIGLTTGTPTLFRVFSVSISIGGTQDREGGQEPVCSSLLRFSTPLRVPTVWNLVMISESIC